MRRAITLGDSWGGPYIVADCHPRGWNGWHMPYLTADELADHIYAWKMHDPNGEWSGIHVMTDAPEGIIMHIDETDEDDMWEYDEDTGRTYVDGLCWSTARDENGDEIAV